MSVSNPLPTTSIGNPLLVFLPLSAQQRREQTFFFFAILLLFQTVEENQQREGMVKGEGLALWRSLQRLPRFVSRLSLPPHSLLCVGSARRDFVRCGRAAAIPHTHEHDLPPPPPPPFWYLHTHRLGLVLSLLVATGPVLSLPVCFDRQRQ